MDDSDGSSSSAGSDSACMSDDSEAPPPRPWTVGPREHHLRRWGPGWLKRHKEQEGDLEAGPWLPCSTCGNRAGSTFGASHSPPMLSCYTCFRDHVSMITEVMARKKYPLIAMDAPFWQRLRRDGKVSTSIKWSSYGGSATYYFVKDIDAEMLRRWESREKMDEALAEHRKKVRLLKRMTTSKYSVRHWEEAGLSSAVMGLDSLIPDEIVCLIVEIMHGVRPKGRARVPRSRSGKAKKRKRDTTAADG